MHKVCHDMKERKNFLMLAIGMGVVGIIIGAITIWEMTSELLSP